MGCKASVTSSSTIKSQPTVSRACSPIDFAAFPSAQPTVEKCIVPNLQDSSAQTKPLQSAEVPVKVKATESKDLKDVAAPVRDTTDPSKYHGPVTPNPRLTANPRSYNTKWVLVGLDAQEFTMQCSKDVMSIPRTAIQDAVAAIKKETALKDLPVEVWNLLDSAAQKDDATDLIQVYTFECDFYRILNRTLAQYENSATAGMDLTERLMLLMGGALETMNSVVNSLQAYQAGQTVTVSSTETNWARLFLKPLFRLLGIPNATLRYQGKAYRGVWLTISDIKCYEDDSQFICNKAITSTSKSRVVAQSFIDAVSTQSTDVIPVMFTYVIEADSALYALDISQYSQIPYEEEVLLLPGVLWMVTGVKKIENHGLEIELRSGFRKILEKFGPGAASAGCPIQ